MALLFLGAQHEQGVISHPHGNNGSQRVLSPRHKAGTALRAEVPSRPHLEEEEVNVEVWVSRAVAWLTPPFPGLQSRQRARRPPPEELPCLALCLGPAQDPLDPPGPAAAPGPLGEGG